MGERKSKLLPTFDGSKRALRHRRRLSLNVTTTEEQDNKNKNKNKTEHRTHYILYIIIIITTGERRNTEKDTSVIYIYKKRVLIFKDELQIFRVSMQKSTAAKRPTLFLTFTQLHLTHLNTYTQTMI